MTPKWTREQVLAGVQIDAAQTLGIEPEEVDTPLNFFHDLGGESIDILDLGFRSERRLGIRSPFSKLGNPDVWRLDGAGQLNEGLLRHLKAELPRIDWETRLANLSPRSAKDIATIDLLVELLYQAQFEPEAASTL